MDKRPKGIKLKTAKDLLNKIQKGVTPTGEVNYKQPDSEIQKSVYQIWQEVLGHDNFGVQDDFFSLGGNSLKGVRVVSKIIQHFRHSFELTDIFLHSNIENLSAFIEEKVKSSAESEPFHKIVRPELLPLSFGQERLWFIHQLEGSTQYHIPAVFRIKGRLNESALVNSLREMVNRHEVLRTAIRTQNGKPYQFILSENLWEPEFLDLTNQKEDLFTDELILKLVNEPFDLEKDHKIRATLLKRSKDEQWLVITLHHIASDGWSTSVILKEIELLYKVFSEPAPVLPPKIEFQYADYAVWQKDSYEKDIADKLNYWKENLEGVQPLQFPTDYTRPKVQSINGDEIEFYIPSGLKSKLEALGLQNHATLFMTLFAGFNALLNRYTGNHDLCIGTPVANRPRQEFENLIGFFVNTLALRNRIEEKDSFVSLLERVRENTLQAYLHQEVPFEKVVEATANKRELDTTPLFQVMFILQNRNDLSDAGLKDIEIEEKRFHQNTSLFDLTFSFVEHEDGLKGVVEYCTDLFKRSSVESLADHFVNLLESVTADPNASIKSLNIVGVQEEHKILHEFRGMKKEFPENATVVGLFEDQVRSNPESIAVVDEHSELSYAQLNHKVNHLAEHLLSIGAKRSSRIPVILPKSTEMMAAILAILKTGASYVPIDPSFPDQRKKFIIQDCEAELVIGEALKLQKLKLGKSVKAVDPSLIDEQRQAVLKNPSSEISALTEAYVMYTSGSTGNPKGVRVSHRNIVSLVKGIDYVSFKSSDVLLSSGSVSFDATTFEYWGMLLNGGKLILVSDDTLLNSKVLMKEIQKHRVNLMWFTAGWFNFLVNTEIELFKGLHTILVGGEKLSEPHVEKLRNYHPELSILNGYGPTENTTFSLTYPIKETAFTGSVPIGKPLSNRTVYILDEFQNIVPPGITGEIYLGGAGLSLGYLNNPELNSEKFVEVPSLRSVENRLYKTGDLGKWLEDGNVIYTGRVDQQIKIRGYRIEPGEIENAILQHPDIVQAFVNVFDAENSGKQLVAYIVKAKDISTPDKEEFISSLKKFISGKVPEFMVPVFWVSLPELPLTPNGKVDSRSLPLPDLTENISLVYQAPGTQMEEDVCKVWSRLLGLEKIGVLDNFFELGGHSLLAMTLVSDLSSELNIDLQVRDLFMNPTVQELAICLSEKSNLHRVSEIKPAIKPELIPLSFSQERLWFIDKLEGSLSYHVSAILNIKGPLNKEILEAALKRIVSRHEILRTVILEEGGKAYQTLLTSEAWKLELLDPLRTSRFIADEKGGLKSLIERPFDLSSDYMLRATLIEPDKKNCKLIVTMHHISSDASSLAVLVDELGYYYEQLSFQSTDLRPPLHLQYSDYAIWQRKYLSGEVLEQKLDYWKSKLKGVSPLKLTTDFERPAKRSNRGSQIYFYIDQSQSQKLYNLAKLENATLYMTLMAVFKVLLNKYARQRDICVGFSIANRTHKEIEDLIGFFVNTIALRTDVNEEDSFRSLLGQVKKNTLEAYENQEVPFEKVVDATVVERDISRSPLFQVMFVLVNTPEISSLKLGDTQIEVQNYEADVSKFDFSFFVKETSGGLKCSVEYSVDLFKRETIEQVAEHFRELIRSVVDNPNQKIGLLNMISAEEEKKLLKTFNLSSVKYPHELTFVDLFEKQVEKTPDSIALVYEDIRITYAELNNSANQIAHYLLSLKLGENPMIPIILESGIPRIQSILGILKSGAAYVPVDPENLLEKINFILEDVHAKIVLSNAEFSDTLKQNKKVKVLKVDEFIAGNTEMAGDPSKKPLPGDLIYVIYTSGSTGEPKGVMIEHRCIMDYLYGLDQSCNINGFGSYAFLQSIATDLGNTILFSALISGGALHLFSKQAASDAEHLIRYFDENKIDCLKIVPSHWNALKTEDRMLLPEKLLIFGGDVLRYDLVNEINAHGNACQIINHYGPTETSIGKLIFKVEPDKKYRRNIPIGKTFSNSKIYVLNRKLQLCPVGVPGELFISGDGLARGYLNNKELTDQKFIDNPFSKNKSEKLYRTGDLVQLTGKGNVIFLGRVDSQVKIRGFRIELGEIESALQDLESIKQAVVLAKEDQLLNRRLVAYVLKKEDHTATVSEIQESLQEKLPEYMIPATFVFMDSFPLTPNGKIEKRALPEPDYSSSADQYTSARNETELALTQIWQELLDLEQVGIHDNFFELGGDSIITIQLVSRARRVGIELQVDDVFTYQTIERLSALLEHRSSSDILSQNREPLTGNCGLLPVQQWFFEKDTSNRSHFNQSILLKIDKRIGVSELKGAFKQLKNQHDSLRFKYFQDDTGNWRQAYAHDENDCVYLEDLSIVQKNTLPDVLEKKCNEYQRSLQIEKAEILKVVLFKTSHEEEYNRVLFVIHHLATDGVSWRILFDDLEILLSAYLNQEKAALGPKSDSVKDWYENLGAYLNSDRLKAQLPFWRANLANRNTLPYDFLKEGVLKVKDTQNIDLILEQDLTEKLIHELPSFFHAEIGEILVSTLAIAMTEWYGKNEISIELEGHGREKIGKTDVSRTIGWFTTHYPVCLKTGEESILNNLRSVKEQLRKIPDKGLGFGVLKYLGNLSEFKDTVKPEIKFNYLGRLDNVLKESKWFKVSSESYGNLMDPETEVEEKISLICSVSEGKLRLNWTCSKIHFKPETIRSLSDRFLQTLQNIIALTEVRSAGTILKTPSDYVLGEEIEYRDLDRFLIETFNNKPRYESLEGLYRLSGLQLGMLFHELYDGGGYVNLFSCDLIQPDLVVFKKSWEYILKKHSVLRSAFYHSEFSIPVQVVYKFNGVDIEVFDYTKYTGEELENELKKFEINDKKRGFDLRTGRLLRVSLIKISADKYRMIWTSHHLLFDGWSRFIIIEEFLRAYDDLKEGKKLQFDAGFQFEEYIRYLEKIHKEDEINFWKTYLSGLTESTQFPFIITNSDRNKGLGKYKNITHHLDRSFSLRIHEFSQKNRLTLNTIVQGVWAFLLHKYCGRNNVAFGITVSGRPADLPGIEKRVGLFINTIPLHSTFNEELSVVDWLNGIITNQVNAQRYQFTPLQEIQNVSGIKGDLFDSILVFDNYPVDEAISGEDRKLKIENLKVTEQTNYPMNVTVAMGNSISVDFMINSDLIRDEFVEVVFSNFKNVLEQFILKSTDRIGSIELLSEDEHEKILDLNPKFEPDFLQQNVLERIEKQIFENPDRTAFIYGKEEISYLELKKRSDHLASYLSAKGVQKDEMVPVMIERSIDWIVSVLAIWKAGSAFVPVDIDYPEERIKFILNDINAKVLLVQKAEDAGNSVPDNVEILEVGNIADSEKDPEIKVPDANQVAYVLYTSGSTGFPKGVLVQHRNLSNYLFNKKINYLNNEQSGPATYIHFAATFDASITAMFLPLIHGRTSVISTLKGTEIFKDVNFLKHAPYDFIKLTPAHVELIGENFLKNDKPVTGRLVLGGEALFGNHLKYFAENKYNVEIINEYGPTEATVGCSIYKLNTSKPLLNFSGSVWIGKPLDHTEIFILNTEGKIQPIGLPGEICISGDSVTKGYLNLEDLTKKKFVDLTLMNGHSRKVYRTGDVGRWLPEGELEFLGRNDDQVKLRGHRIELGEIETQISNVSNIRTSKVMLVRNQEDTDGFLKAFVQIDKEKLPVLSSCIQVVNTKHELATHLTLLPNGLPHFSTGQDLSNLPDIETSRAIGDFLNNIGLNNKSVIVDLNCMDGEAEVMFSITGADPQVLSIEPHPGNLENIQANRELYQVKGKILPLVLSDRKENMCLDITSVSETKFLLEPENKSLKSFSGAYVLKPEELQAYIDFAKREQKFNVSTFTISDVIRNEKLDKIDLLSIGNKYATLSILGGIERQDWKKIQNILIESKGTDPDNKVLTDHLKLNGFEVKFIKPAQSQETGLNYTFAFKADKPSELAFDELVTRKLQQWVHPVEQIGLIKNELEQKLPSLMVPPSIVLVDRFPLTLNGKLDLKALSKIDAEIFSSLKANEEEQSGLDPLEASLVQIWKDLLELNSISIQDDFFEIGGHSLLAIRLISAIRKELNMEVSMADVFDHSTISKLALKLRSENKETFVLPAVIADNRPEHIPLSYSQERLWFIDNIEGSTQYHIPALFRIRGNLDLSALEASLKEIIDRHEVLRTVLVEKDGKVEQVIQPPDNWELIQIGVSGPESKNRSPEQVLLNLVSIPFNLSEDFMLRAHILKSGKNEYRLLVTIHHIAADGWSLSLFVKEILELYSAYSEKKTSSLDAVKIQYADYAIWQRKYLSGEFLDRKIDFWKRKLNNVPVMQFPLDYDRPVNRTTNGARSQYYFENQLLEGVKELNKKYGTTHFITLFTVFNILINRYTGQEDLCIGTPVANRNSAEYEDLIGFFVNTLAVRTRVSSDRNFDSLISECKTEVLEMFQHADVPFEKVVDAVVETRDLNRNPLYQILFSMQNNPEIPEIRYKDVEIELEEIEHKTAQLDLILNVTEQVDGFGISVEYCTDLFKPSTIDRIISHFKNILYEVIRNPKLRVSEIEMLSGQEKDQILNIFNLPVEPLDTKGPGNLVRVFEKIAFDEPEKTAIVYKDQRLTYGELNLEANRIANHLISQKIGKENYVPVCLENGPMQIIVLLGILKSGAAYVPVDPNYPEDRVRYILSDCGSKMVITAKDHAALFTVAQNLSLLLIDEEQNAIATMSSDNPETKISGDQTAYIIYTSGSTGVPKGVLASHSNLYNYIMLNKDFYLDKNTNSTGSFRHLSFTFDASLTGIFISLSSGKTIVISSGSSGEMFEDENLQNNAPYDFIKVTPSHIPLLKEKLRLKNGNLLTKRIIVGGEALTFGHVKQLKEANVNIEIFNEYGPTETTVGCAFYNFELKNSDKLTGNSVSIGKPMKNCNLYLLDKSMNLVPVGVPGEIYIAGEQVTKGYLGKPELTNEKFVKNPFNEKGKLYRSGDMAKWYEDGNLIFLGRTDDQIKHKGYRIELGEIENALQSIPAVKQSVVMLKKDSKEHGKLVCYLVPGKDFELNMVRKELAGKLPDYMLPELWKEMAEFPLTINGKIDKTALPEVDVLEQIQNKFTAAGNEIEETLCRIWGDVLDIEKVGVEDNFFDLGGDSIVVVQIVSRVRKEGFEMKISDIFSHQSISKLAVLLSVRSISESSGSEMQKPVGESGMIPVQRWFFKQNHKHPDHFNQRVLVSLIKTIDKDMLGKALDKIVEQHDGLGFRYVRKEKDVHQIYGNAKTEVYTEDLSKIDQKDLSAKVEEVSNRYQSSLNIEFGDVFKVVLMRTPETEDFNRLLVVVHHLVIDGISWRILFEDLSLLLAAALEGKDASFPQKSSTFKDWYSELEQYSKQDDLDQESKYWQRVNRSYEPLPSDMDNPRSVLMEDTETIVLDLEKELTANLLQKVPGVYHTEINEVLLAGLSQAFFQKYGLKNLNIGVEGHGREESIGKVDLSRTLGWFTSIYPVNIENEETEDEGQLLKSVKEQYRKIPGKGLGYGILKHMLNAPELNDGDPWDIMFNYLGQADTNAETSSLFNQAPENGGSNIHPQNYFSGKIHVNAMVENGVMSFKWTYSKLNYKEKSIQELTDLFKTNLSSIVSHCLGQDRIYLSKTPSDFNLGSEIDFRSFDEFLLEPHNNDQNRLLDFQSIHGLSGLQQGILYHGLFDENTGAYMVQFECEFFGLNLEAFNEAWEYVIQQHSALRSAFYADRFSIPVQCFYKKAKLPVEHIDLSEKSEEAQENEIRNYCLSDSTKAFDFSKPPLMRVALFNRGSGQYHMLWTSHHLLFDGWSLPVLMEEFLNVYDKLFLQKKIFSKPEDKFEDYLQYLESRDRKEETKYWRNYTSKLDSPTLLPFVKVSANRNAGMGTYRSEILEFTNETTGKVRNFAKKNRVTVNTIIQGVWSVLLHKYTGQDRISFGVIVSGRPDDLSNVENRVGMFINTLPLVSELNEDTSVSEWLWNLQSEQVNSRKYQYSALHEIQAMTGIQGDLFDSILVFENFPVSKIVAEQNWSLKVEEVKITEQTNYPITLTVSDTETLKIRFRYNTSLLEEEQVLRIREHFMVAIEQVLEIRDLKVDQIDILSREEKATLYEFGSSKVDYPSGSTIPELFTRMVTEKRDQIALSFQNETISYEELDKRSNKLAHSILTKGAGSKYIPLLFDRSLEMIVAMLAVLKSGAAYLPVDPEYPEERIRYIVEDSGSKIILSHKQHGQNIKGTLCLRVDQPKSFNELPDTLPEINIGPDDLAYVIYTSGSTGNPKGVEIQHKALIDHCYGLMHETCLSDCKNFALFSPMVFDAGHAIIHTSLITGGNLFVIPDQLIADAGGLSQYVESSGIDCIKIVPSLWMTYAEAGYGILANKVMIFGGDVFSNEVLNELKKRKYIGEVYNHYGPTEATIGKTIHKVDLNKAYNRVPIGKPFSNTSLYVLDNRLKPVPVGVNGQLYIAGDGLAKGYLGNKELTSGFFIENPLKPGTKMYKTGDEVRWDKNGDLYYIGRLDDQVKIRGYRVETAEIENQMNNSGLVERCLVIAGKDKRNVNRLSAYVILRSGKDIESVKIQLKKKLPDYMIPEFWFELNEFPLNLNGKIDRKALPDPYSQDLSEKEFVQATTETEMRLTEIWKDLLNKDTIGIHDNFFELGGHSLLVIRLLAAIKKKYEVQLSIATFFELGNIENLSGYIELNRKAEHESEDDMESMTL
ncbi:MAG: non-ribosomal peptide synthase/polyketide synthase [Flavobacteriales bacterium]|nr:non-ribosomal peptide synthase/polyketide synthase [Flavobacteriales bacterium]